MLTKSLAGQLGMLCAWPNSAQGYGGGEAPQQRVGTKRNERKKKKAPAKRQPKSKYAAIPEWKEYKKNLKALQDAKKRHGLSKSDRDDPRIQEELASYQEASDKWFETKFAMEKGGGSDSTMALPQRVRQTTNILPNTRQVEKFISDHLRMTGQRIDTGTAITAITNGKSAGDAQIV